jgi:hypothetical protein
LLVGLPVILFLLIFSIYSRPVRAQQPFITDNTDVTPRHRFHFEFSNEFDELQRASFPNLKQNTADFELDYGLFEHVEIGVEAPILTIINERSTLIPRASGLGDMNLSLKYNFVRESSGRRRPAMAIGFNFELPTGDTRRQLGSGISDFYVNGILQKSLTKNTTLRANAGLLFSGNDTTGVIGVKSRGKVLTGGASLIKQFNSKLDLGFEFASAFARNSGLGKSQLQFMVGGNYLLNPKTSFDFGFVAGRHAASPRLGVQLGLSIDF